jgi:hypothetical protein
MMCCMTVTGGQLRTGLEVHFSTLLLSLLHLSGRTLGQPVKGPDVALGLLRHRTHWFRTLNITEIE